MLEKYIETLCSNNFSEIPCFSDYCISGYVRIIINLAFFANRISLRNSKHAKFKLNNKSKRKSPYSQSKKLVKFISEKIREH